jgi:hypothetical protein
MQLDRLMSAYSPLFFTNSNPVIEKELGGIIFPST